MALKQLASAHANPSIVIAEDEVIVARDLKLRLTRLGYAVLAIARTGEDAVKETLAHMPDIVLLDVRLKGNIDGIQAARNIRSAADIPVVFATASSEEATFERSKQADPYGYLIKPYDDRELQAALDLAITKHRSEKMARESETRYRLLYENNLAGVFRLDRDGQILDCNGALLTMLGGPSDLHAGDPSPLTLLAAPADQTRLMMELHAQGRIEGKELCLHRSDGSVVWGLANIVETSGGVFVGTIVDITGRKRIEAELSEHRQMLELLIDNIPDQIYIKDRQGRFLFCNPETLKVLGKSGTSVIGKTDADIFPPDLARQFAADENRVLESGEPVMNREDPLIEADGAMHWSLTKKIPIRGADGSINGLIGIHVDITPRKKFEEILRKELQFQQTLLDAIPAPVFYRDRAGRYLGCNKAFERFYACRRGAIIGKTPGQVLPTDHGETQMRSDSMLIANPGSIMYDIVTTNAAGTQRTGVIHEATFEDAQGMVEGVIGVFSDLSDQQTLREQLVHSEQRYRSMFEGSHAVMLLIDPVTGNFLDVNPAAVAFYGFSRDEFIKKNVSDINTEPLEKLKEILTRASKGTQGQFQWKHRLASGEMRHVEVHTGPVTLDGGTVLLSIVHDITARKLAEEAQRVSDERFRIISENVPDMIALLGSDGRIEYTSSAYRNLGVDNKQLRGSLFLDMVHPSDAPVVQKAFSQSSQTLRHQSVEHQIRGSGESWRMVDTSITFLIDDLESRFITVSRDITERRRREQLVQKLSSAVEHSPASIIITDSMGTIEYVNPKFCEVTGYSAEEALGRNPRMLNSGTTSAEQYAHLWGTITSGREWSGRVSNKRKDGSQYWEQTSISPIAGSDGVITHFVAVQEDISDQIRQDQERQALSEELSKRNEELERMVAELRQVQDGLVQSEKMASIGQLTAGIAHEINNPLAFVSSNLNRFQEYFEDAMGLLGKWIDFGGRLSLTGKLELEMAELNTEQERVDLHFLADDFGKLMGHTREGTNRIKRIVEQLRGFTHLSGDGLSEVDINEALEDSVMITWNELKYKATLIREYGEIPRVSCNMGEMKQVFVNLLVNAAHAIPEKGEIRLRTHATNDDIIIDIQDTGCGIPVANLKRIFDPFFTTKPVGKGTGLGLWITATLVQKHMGSIVALSEEGKGTTFTISLPIRQPESLKEDS